MSVTISTDQIFQIQFLTGGTPRLDTDRFPSYNRQVCPY